MLGNQDSVERRREPKMRKIYFLISKSIEPGSRDR
jgi:hypothetical protein